MNITLIAAIVIITLALVFYSIGVLGEARRRLLLWRDVAWFGAGLTCDAAGTGVMTWMTANGERVLAPWAGTLMAVSGTAAITLMAIHIVFAVIVMRGESYRTRFHGWSLVIYALWLVSYVLGPIGLLA